MMKHLLILLTVLTAASVANAALKISVDGVIDPPDTVIGVMPSDTVIIDIWGDGQTPAPLAAWLISEGPGTLAGGEILYPGTLSSIGIILPPDPGFDDIKAWLESEGYVDVQAIGYIELAHGGAVQPPTDGTLADNIQFHAENEMRDVVLSLVSADLTITYDTQVIHIPEPITFALLGLGGLFLHRRS